MAVTSSHASPPLQRRLPRMEVELSIVMPCLNEAETLARCVEAASDAIGELGVVGEVIVADNGSTDGSREIAERLGARVVEVPARGYGSALRAGMAAARGRFVIMGDADDSYDFRSIGPFLQKLRTGHDLVIGNRFKGGIAPGAMPWPNRWIGNPVLSGLGRLFFRSPVGDFHCGLRGIRRSAFKRLDLHCSGMEFASEMVVKAALKGLRITEVPATLRPDGRSRPPHLRRWRDGWRHLRFMLLFSPRWLFLHPGLALMASSAALSAWLLPGPLRIGELELDVHTLLVAGFLCLVGYQLVVFAVFTKVFAIREGFHPPSPLLDRLFRRVTLETGLGTGSLVAIAGSVILAGAFLRWGASGFGQLDPRLTMRLVIPAVVLLALGIQTIFASFFLSILGIGRDQVL